MKVGFILSRNVKVVLKNSAKFTSVIFQIMPVWKVTPDKFLKQEVTLTHYLSR